MYYSSDVACASALGRSTGEDAQLVSSGFDQFDDGVGGEIGCIVVCGKGCVQSC